MKLAHERSSHASRAAHQLDAIEASIKKLMLTRRGGKAANDAHQHRPVSSKNVHICRHGSFIELKTGNPHKQMDLQLIHVHPLFQGSFSQSEVVISYEPYYDPSCGPGNGKSDNSQPRVKTNKPMIADQALLRPIDPELFFTRFTTGTIKPFPMSDTWAPGLLIVLPEAASLFPQRPVRQRGSTHSNLSELLSPTAPLQHLLRYRPLFLLARSITVVHWNTIDRGIYTAINVLFDKLFCPDAANKQQVSTAIRQMTVSNDDSLSFFELLSHHEFALLPDTGLAMDALNAGCVSEVWLQENCCLRQLPKPDIDLSEPADARAALRQFANEQRERLINRQLTRYQKSVIATHPDALTDALDDALERIAPDRNGPGIKSCPQLLGDVQSLPKNSSLRHVSANAANDEDFVLPLKNHTETPTSSCLIIPPDYEAARGHRFRTRRAADRILRRMRKLYRSPGQFLTDSRFRMFRALGVIWFRLRQ